VSERGADFDIVVVGAGAVRLAHDRRLHDGGASGSPRRTKRRQRWRGGEPAHGVLQSKAARHRCVAAAG